MMDIASHYKTHIDTCISNANASNSKCTQDILSIDGMSGSMTRHLYNNMCSLEKLDGSKTNYLEIGAWKGSSTVSALYQNSCLATIIDNWSEFGGPKEEFQANMSKYFESRLQNGEIQIINEDAYNLVTRLQFAPYDIYMFDGNHTVESHEKAFTTLWPYLADTCIIMVDDWNWPCVKQGTEQGLANVGARVLYSVDIASPEGAHGFWNGCGVFLVQKQ